MKDRQNRQIEEIDRSHNAKQKENATEQKNNENTKRKKKINKKKDAIREIPLE